MPLFKEVTILGLYSGIFALYLQYHSSKKETDNATQNIFYALCVLYVLSVALIALDIAIFLATFVSNNEPLFFPTSH